MSDAQKRIHTLLTDGAVAGLSAREREELELLLDGEPIDPSYEQAAAAIELGLMRQLDQGQRMPVAIEAAILQQASRYWGFAETRPREPTLGGVDGGLLLLGSDIESGSESGVESGPAPVRRVWERSPGLGDFDSLDDALEAGVLESSLTHGRIDRSIQYDRNGARPAEADPDSGLIFDTEVDAQLDALEHTEREQPASGEADDLDALDDLDSLDDLDDHDELGEPQADAPVARRRTTSRRRKRGPNQSQAMPVVEVSGESGGVGPIARWATYVSAIAALIMLAVALWLFVRRDEPVDPNDITADIETSADKQEWSFTVQPDEFVGEGAEGSVLWSSDLQTGVLTLRGLAANDPTAAQYQLWIVDSTREGPAVDGGVFDVPAGEDEARIAIDAKLLIGEPQEFRITIERPGGVVVSDQARVVMVATQD